MCTERGHLKCERRSLLGEWWTVHHPMPLEDDSVVTAAGGRGNPKRVLTAEDETRIREVLVLRDNAVESVRRAVLDAASHGASVRVLAEFTGMSTNTISRWKADAEPSVP